MTNTLAVCRGSVLTSIFQLLHTVAIPRRQRTGTSRKTWVPLYKLGNSSIVVSHEAITCVRLGQVQPRSFIESILVFEATGDRARCRGLESRGLDRAGHEDRWCDGMRKGCSSGAGRIS